MKWNLLSRWPARRRRPVLLRLAADLALTNLSMAAAFCGWFAYYVAFRPATDIAGLRAYYWFLYRENAWLWSATFLAVFALHGFYTRSRTYRGWHRLAGVLRAVAAAFLAFLFVSYFVHRNATIPRGVMLVGLLLTMLSVAGARMAALLFRGLYRVERRDDPASRDIRTVLVVGGAGYIGSVLVRRLLELGYGVRVLDCFLYGADSLEDIAAHPALEVHQGDFRNIPTVVEAVRGCDAIIHLAAIVGDPACAVDEVATRQINDTATRLLAEVAKGFRVARFLFASTCSVYGASDELLDECSGLHPLSLYAQTKVDSEQALLAAKSASFCPVILRLGTAFGLSPRPRFDLVVNLLSARAATEGKITIHNGSQWRPFVHVEDIARAFIACLEAPRALVHGEIFNIGSERLNHTLAEVAGEVLAVAPGIQVEYAPDSDARNYRVSFQKAERRLSFRCEKTLADGVREIQQAFVLGRIADYRNPRYNNHKFLEENGEAVACRDSDFPLLQKAPAYA